jgi:hypothetical protein
MQPTPQPHPKPRTLDELMANAEHYANHAMRKSGRVPPAFFLVGVDGQVMASPEQLVDGQSKDDFANMARFLCIAHAATACVMVLEVWAKFASPDEPLDPSEPPSEAIDRREFVVLMGESRDGCRHKFIPIVRSGNGRFFGFGEAENPGHDQMEGRFAQLLPDKVPDQQMRELARAVLKVKGAGSITSRRRR